MDALMMTSVWKKEEGIGQNATRLINGRKIVSIGAMDMRRLAETPARLVYRSGSITIMCGILQDAEEPDGEYQDVSSEVMGASQYMEHYTDSLPRALTWLMQP
jgi:hypothetical protein